MNVFIALKGFRFWFLFSLSVNCIKIELPIPREGFPSKRPADVKDIFDHSYAEAILKRMFNHQNKEVEKNKKQNKKKKRWNHLNMLREIC